MTRDERWQRFEARALAPLGPASRIWYAWMALLLALVVVGFVAYASQLRDGLAVTGMRDSVTWGVYISNFVFFSGLSMAGTFISAILRLTGAEWRRPLTRFSELTTVAALSMCALMPAIDMGRPDRLMNLVLHAQLESPLVWDIMVIPTYLAASALYLYLFLIPDAALLRDRATQQARGLRHRLYSFLAAGFHGTPRQRHRLELLGGVMMLLVMPLGVATHSVVSWIFGMTYRAGWDSAIFAPYFVVGALYSGTAMLISLMFIFRRLLGLQEYLTEKHFKYLATMLVAFGAGYLYFTFADYLTSAYKMQGGEDELLQVLFFGKYAPLVWIGFVGGQIIPMILASVPRTRTIPILFGVSILVNIGMWIKRFIIVVPTLTVPLLPYSWGVYNPTWVEYAITAASFAGFALIITVFVKLFPIISVTEMEEGWEHLTGEPEREPAPRPSVHPMPRWGRLVPRFGGARR